MVPTWRGPPKASRARASGDSWAGGHVHSGGRRTPTPQRQKLLLSGRSQTSPPTLLAGTFTCVLHHGPSQAGNRKQVFP